MSPTEFPAARPASLAAAERLLAAGTTEWMQLPKGAQIFLQEGRLRLHEPAVWLADTLWQPVHWLHAGQAHEVARHGWVRLEAGERCVLHLQLKPGLWQRLSAAAAGCIAAAGRLAARWTALQRARQSGAAAGQQRRRIAENC